MEGGEGYFYQISNSRGCGFMLNKKQNCGGGGQYLYKNILFLYLHFWLALEEPT